MERGLCSGTYPCRIANISHSGAVYSGNNMKLQIAAVLVAGACLAFARAAEEGQARRSSVPSASTNQVQSAAAPLAISPDLRIEKDQLLSGAWQKRSSYLRGRIYHSAVWTYGEMIVWGGGSEHR